MEIFMLLLILISLILYFLPAIIASTRSAKNETPIWILTILVGWTLIGWIAMLIWACTDKEKETKEDKK